MCIFLGVLINMVSHMVLSFPLLILGTKGLFPHDYCYLTTPHFLFINYFFFTNLVSLVSWLISLIFKEVLGFGELAVCSNVSCTLSGIGTMCDLLCLTELFFVVTMEEKWLRYLIMTSLCRFLWKLHPWLPRLMLVFVINVEVAVLFFSNVGWVYVADVTVRNLNPIMKTVIT